MCWTSATKQLVLNSKQLGQYSIIRKEELYNYLSISTGLECLRKSSISLQEKYYRLKKELYIFARKLLQA